MKDALAIHRMLLERETPHEIVRLPSAISHADELPKVLDLPAERCLVTHVYTVGSSRREASALAGVVVQAGREPIAEIVRRRLNARTIRHARADQINAATEYAAHLVSPLLLPPAMRLFIDRRIIEGAPADGVVYTAAGEPFTALGIRFADLHLLSGAEPISFPAAGTEFTPPTPPTSPSPAVLPAPSATSAGTASTVTRGPLTTG